jgi:hypothetical protein
MNDDRADSATANDAEPSAVGSLTDLEPRIAITAWIDGRTQAGRIARKHYTVTAARPMLYPASPARVAAGVMPMRPPEQARAQTALVMLFEHVAKITAKAPALPGSLSGAVLRQN